MDLSDITVVILSRGREVVLRKTLEYWNQFDISVMVFHNTESPIDTKEFSTRISYNVSELNYGERCQQIPKLLETQYAILSADDEFYLPSALLKMKAILDNNSDLQSVGGQTVAVGKYGPIKTGYFAYSNMIGYKNNHESPEDRLNSHFNSQNGYLNGGMYRLMRRNLMSQMLQAFGVVSKFTTPYIYEITGEFIVNAYGKSIYISDLYWLRNWVVAPVNNDKWDRRLYVKEWATSEKYSEQFESWRNLLISLLKIEEAELKNILDNFLEIRFRSEEREIAQMSRKKINVSPYFKYILRLIFSPKSLPSNLRKTLERIKQKQIDFDDNEINNALTSLFS